MFAWLSFLSALIATGQSSDNGEAWTTSRTASAQLERELQALHAQSQLPAIWAGKFHHDGRSAMAAVGIRKSGEDAAASINDRIHLGSCTKAMTAVMIAQAVSAGKIRWSSTLGEVFSGMPAMRDSPWRDVSVMDLLRHRSGAPANARWQSLHEAHPTDVVASRRAMLSWLLEQKRPKEREYLYSNVGYALLGHILETVEKVQWEELARLRLFAPLGITTAGFGPVMGETDSAQPWGHVENGDLKKLVESALGKDGERASLNLKPIRHDNPPPLGPAGRVHMSMMDWARFVTLFATAAPPPIDLGITAADWKTLHDPGEGDYAGGWVLAERDWADGQVLNHAGSNTMWYCVAWVAPRKDFFVLIATNCAIDSANPTCDAVAGTLIGLELDAD